MNGIYGDVLLAFAEQFRTFKAFTMEALINGGWALDEDSEITVQGIMQNGSGKHLKDSNGNLVTTRGLEFWTREENLDGYFISFEEDIYRLETSNDWTFEGGYTRYSLSKVVGNNGTESIDPSWNTGSNSFS